MAVKFTEIAGIGPVKLVKRRGSKSLRLSLTHDGFVRISMPTWVPYSKGIDFAKSRRDWIVEHLEKNRSAELKNGMRIGKSHFLVYQISEAGTTKTRIKNGSVIITASLPLDHPEVKLKAEAAAERALKKEAEELFPPRIKYLADQHGYKYRQLKIKKMRSRWGSCSSTQIISLSSFLVQLPWPLIDYVIVHELLHTKHMHHGAQFWKEFEDIIPDAKKIRRQVNNFKPKLMG